MTITGKIEPSDCRRAAWVHMKPRPLFAVVGSILAVLVLIVFALAIYGLITSGRDLGVVLGLSGALVFLGIYFFVWVPWCINRLYAQQKLLHSEFTAEISEEHLVSTSTHGQSTVPWSVFHKWKRGRDMVLLYQSDRLFHVFPARWFQSAQDFETFQTILRKHLGHQRV